MVVVEVVSVVGEEDTGSGIVVVVGTFGSRSTAR